MPLDLTPELQRIAVDALRGYLNAPPLQNGLTPIEIEAELDSKRVQLIESSLRPLLTDYLRSSLSTADFKRQIDSINKQNSLWGFSGIKGQMFFNMVVKTAEDGAELDDQLRSAIQNPGNEENAIALLRNFKGYVTRIGQQFIDGGGDPHSKPKSTSVSFFLSYFWQIHRRDVWPVYYTNTI